MTGTRPAGIGAVPPPPARRSRFDAALLPIGAAVVVLAGAIIFLLVSPRDRPIREAETRDAALTRLDTLDTRLTAVERRPGIDGLPERIAAAETGLRDLAARPVNDAEARSGLDALRNATMEATRRIEERTAALDTRITEADRNATARTAEADRTATTRIAELERATTARAAEVARTAEERAAALEGRVTESDRRTEGRIAEAERRAESRIAAAEATLANRLTGAEQALAARVTAAEQAFAPRLQTLDAALNERVAAAGAQVNRRLDEAGAALDQRLSTQETQQRERIAAQERQLAQRIEDFQNRLAQAEAAERRLTRLAARGTIQSALEAGRPLGPALAGLGDDVPPALVRYRDAAPPTEAALRLNFDEAARAARAAAEPQGGTVGENALARLGGLVTVRRGDQVVVGDPVSGELERASRSLDAGDLAGAVARLERLPEPSRRAMAGWIGQARDLVEARSAVRDIGATPSSTTPAGNRG
ncbi:mitofilin family membrane protein [Roseomonas sp. CCTCC AB2023176]|uniref:mitofilin family membrane protein n=1 Tax=Roseomonas sp. CCTCC AB2023176 TaxID=3342640 RepID=UPI0035DB6DA0